MAIITRFMDASKPHPRKLKGVRYSAALSTKYYKVLRQMLDWMQAEFDRTVVRGLSTKEMVKKTETMIYDESPNERYKKMLALFNKKMRGKFPRKVIEKLVRKALESSSNYSQKEFDRKLKSFGIDFKGGTQKYSSYMSTAVEENVMLVKNLMDEQAKRLKSVVLRGMREGIPSTRLAGDIQRSLGISKRRAATIARTETHKVTQQIADYRAEEAGLTEGIWRAMMDNRTSTQHASFNGRKFNLKKGLWDPKTRSWNWPGRRPNCRCYTEYIIPGD